MWMFTKYGFYSAVCHNPPNDPRMIATTIVVRSRKEKHLKALIARFPAALKDCKINKTHGTDYPVRIYVDREAWTAVTAALSMEIDYGNFKDEAEAQCDGDMQYVGALHQIWEVMKQTEEPKKGNYRG